MIPAVLIRVVDHLPKQRESVVHMVAVLDASSKGVTKAHKVVDSVDVMAAASAANTLGVHAELSEMAFATVMGVLNCAPFPDARGKIEEMVFACRTVVVPAV